MCVHTTVLSANRVVKGEELHRWRLYRHMEGGVVSRELDRRRRKCRMCVILGRKGPYNEVVTGKGLEPDLEEITGHWD